MNNKTIKDQVSSLCYDKHITLTVQQLINY